MADALLTVADVARLRRCDFSTAWRLLLKLERLYGTPLVRDGKTVRISHSELLAGLARMPSRDTLQLRREVSEMRRRITALESEVRRLRTVRAPV